MNKRIVFFFIIMFSFLHCILLEAQVIRFRPGRLRFETQLDYYNTKANYDFPGGSFTSLGPGSSYQMTRSTNKLIYDLNRSWSSGINLIAGTATSDDPSDTRNSSRLHRLEWRTRYIAYRRHFQWIPELLVSGSLFDIADDVDEVLVDDDITRIQIGSWLQKKFFGLYNYLYLGYQSRSDDFSDLGVYKMGTYYRWGKFYVGGEVDGFSSLTDDKFVDTPLQRTVITDRVNAGSLVHYAINPNVSNANGWVGIKAAENFLFKLGYKKSFNGESYADGNTIWVKMEIRSIYQDGSSDEKASEQSKLRKGFEPATAEEDNTIEELFLGEEVEVQLEKGRRDKGDEDLIDDDDE